MLHLRLSSTSDLLFPQEFSLVVLNFTVDHDLWLSAHKCLLKHQVSHLCQLRCASVEQVHELCPSTKRLLLSSDQSRHDFGLSSLRPWASGEELRWWAHPYSWISLFLDQVLSLSQWMKQYPFAQLVSREAWFADGRSKSTRCAFPLGDLRGTPDQDRAQAPQRNKLAAIVAGQLANHLSSPLPSLVLNLASQLRKESQLLTLREVREA